MLRGVVGVALVVCAAVGAFGGVAYADNKEAAKQSYTEGKRQYDIGEYGAALEAFKKAYLNYEEPVFLFNIAQCYRALGDRPAAVRSYRAFLRNWPKAPNREQVERIVTELEAAIAQDETAKKAPPTDTLPPRGAEAQKAPPPATASAPETHPAAPPKSAETSPPATTTPPPTTTAPPPATTSEPRPAVAKKGPPPKDDMGGMVEVEPNFERPSGSGKPLKWWAWTLLAVGAAGIAGAAVAIGVTQTQKSDFKSTLPDFTSHGLRVVSVSF